MNIYRINDRINIELSNEHPSKKLKLNEDDENMKLGEIIIKDSKYYFKSIHKHTSNINNEIINSISDINNLSWLVYKGEKIPSDKSKYSIKEGDVIKLGREILLIKRIHIKKNNNKNQKINNNETKKDNNVMISFHTQTSQSLNLNEDFNNLDNVNNLEEKFNSDNETGGIDDNKKVSDKDINKNKDLISCNESEKNSEIKQKNKKMCRICYMEETNKKINPLIKPCKCSGSMKYIHYECLLHWLKTKVLITNNSYCDNGFYTIYLLNLIECELCKNPLPNYIKHNNKIYSLIDYDKFDKKKMKQKKEKNVNENYIIFDELTSGKPGNKYRYLVKFDDNNIIKIGRGLEMQLILNDISVSRNHCQLKLDEDGNIFLQDCNSKFGSLVLIQADTIEILKGKTLTIQVGTNYLNIKLILSKNLFGCCGVEEIDERNSYEKINSNYVKYDRTNEILNESITPENSDNEEKNEKVHKEELIDKEKDIDKKEVNLNEKMNDLNEKMNENKNIKNISGTIYNISTLKINNDKFKSIPDNVKVIKNRINSLNSKGNSIGDSTTKIKNEEKKKDFKKDNVIISENGNLENEKEEEKNNKDENNKDRENDNNYNSNSDDSESDIDSDESSEDSNSSD